MIEMIWAR